MDRTVREQRVCGEERGVAECAVACVDDYSVGVQQRHSVGGEDGDEELRRYARV